MREYKFRVWDGVDYMSEPFTLQKLMLGEIEFTSECHVMQYTGLKDKNGKEIYEGDILKKWYSRDTTGKDITEWNEAVEFEIALNRSGFTIDFLPSCEIIGNIYERPHLLSITPNPQDNKK